MLQYAPQADGEVLVDVALDAVAVEVEGPHHILGDVVLPEDVEVLLDVVVEELEARAERDAGKEEDAILLEDVMHLLEERLLVRVEEGALHVHHEVHRLGRDHLRYVLRVPRQEVNGLPVPVPAGIVDLQHNHES